VRSGVGETGKVLGVRTCVHVVGMDVITTWSTETGDLISYNGDEEPTVLELVAVVDDGETGRRSNVVVRLLWR